MSENNFLIQSWILIFKLYLKPKLCQVSWPKIINSTKRPQRLTVVWWSEKLLQFTKVVWIPVLQSYQSQRRSAFKVISGVVQESQWLGDKVRPTSTGSTAPDSLSRAVSLLQLPCSCSTHLLKVTTTTSTFVGNFRQLNFVLKQLKEEDQSSSKTEKLVHWTIFCVVRAALQPLTSE